jgi:hypothetical protein
MVSNLAPILGKPRVVVGAYYESRIMGAAADFLKLQLFSF